MKIIDVEQGSAAWLAWRKTLITATDCPAILGSSPWVTAYQCWQRKLGLIEEQKSTEAMERGKRLEPKARLEFMNHHGIEMEPLVVESSEYNFLGASLDGISDNGKYILEIKCGGSDLLKMASKGLIPDYYMDQMQQQLLVTGAEKCFYYCWSENEKYIIEVEPHPTFAAHFLPKAREFLRCIAYSESPALQERDYKDMSSEPLWRIYSEKYNHISEQIKILEELKESYRKEILKLCADHNCKGSGIKVMKVVTRGRIAYDEIPEIKDIDLEKHRKSSTTSWKITTV